MRISPTRWPSTSQTAEFSMSTVTDATSGTQFAASISEINEIRSRDPGRIKRLLVAPSEAGTARSGRQADDHRL